MRHYLISFCLLVVTGMIFANDFLLVGNLAGRVIIASRSYQSAVMEKFATFSRCEIAGKAFLNGRKDAYGGRPDFGKIECINLNDAKNRREIFYK